MEKGVCVRVVGNLSLIPADIRTLIAKAMIMTKDNNKAFLNVAFAYTCKLWILINCQYEIIEMIQNI